MIRIAITDDQPICRKTIRNGLAESPGIQIVLEATDGKDFLEQMGKKPLAERPDLVLMDIDMPLVNGIEAIAIGTIRFPGTRFLVLTVFDDDEKLFEAIQAGASGYLLKDDPSAQLTEAIELAMKYNGVPMSPAMARKTLQWMKQAGSSQRPRISEPRLQLTERETEILLLMVDGLDYRKIAEQLFISPLTVRTHTSRIYEKLHVNSKAQAIQLAHKLKWV
jgi:DNA-binding NarL/FixJ family response regulator